MTTYDQGRFHRIGSRDRSLQPKGPVAVVPRCVGEPLGEDPFEVSAIGDEDPIKVTNSRCQGASSENSPTSVNICRGGVSRNAPRLKVRPADGSKGAWLSASGQPWGWAYSAA